MQNPIEHITSLFERFPGIGARQAKRFAYFLIQNKPAYRKELSQAIEILGTHVYQCKKSLQYFVSDTNEELAPIERDQSRTSTELMIVEKDTDLETIEKTKTYKGKYFVLGGTIPVHELHDLGAFIQLEALTKLLQERQAVLSEIIIALSATPHGDHTLEFLQDYLKDTLDSHIKVTTLGRGLSSGTELEYSDKDTIIHALKNRASKT